MQSVTAQNFGLGLFIFIVITDLLTLLLDLLLKVSGRLTLSEHIWNGDNILGVFFVVWQILGAVGLYLHFFANPDLWIW